MFPFKIPIAQLQSLRERIFYWRVVYYYRLSLQLDLLNRKPLHKFGRFFLGVMAVKLVQKGQRGKKEERIHDYNARKANIAAATAAMWEEELALHTPNPAAAEASVHRQRRISWAVRGNPKALEQARLQMR